MGPNIETDTINSAPEDGAFAEWSAARAHLIMRARGFGRRHLTEEEVAALEPLRAELDAAIAARRAIEESLNKRRA